MKFLAFLTFFIFLNTDINSQEPVNGEGLNAEQIIEMNRPALISIWYHKNNYVNYYTYETKDTTVLNGSGFIFTDDGLIGTNFHVVDGIDSILVKTSDGTFYDAELLLVDEKNDMAIIKIKKNNGHTFPTVRFGNSDNVKVGQEVFAIGSPLGYEYTISQGIVAGIRENEKINFPDPHTYVDIEKNFEKVLQITAAISPGNSGGALFNKKGEVIGITTYTYTGYGNLNFAVAVNSFLRLKNSVDLTNLEDNIEAKNKIAETIFNNYFRLANNYKFEITYNWYYTKQKDTMKTLDTIVIKQDSINQVNFHRAEELYYKCIDMKPDSFKVYQELMDLYVFTERFNNAEKLYISIKENFESDSLLNLLSSSLANAYTTSKDYRKALEFYNKMLRADSSDTYIYLQRAELYEKMGRHKTAIREYKKIIGRDSSLTTAFINLGKIYFEKYNDYYTAKHYLVTANEREMINYGYSSSNLDLHYYLGMIAVKEGKKLEAIMSYMELKNIYTYTPEDNKKKVELYREILKMR